MALQGASAARAALSRSQRLVTPNQGVDLALRLAGDKPTARLVANAKASGSDPTHVVALASAKEVDAEVVSWMRLAYERAARARA